jgi:hypothetical protein
MRVKVLVAALAATLAASSFNAPVFAANHPLNALRYDQASNVVTLDIGLSVDWDYDNPPTRLGQVLDRAYLTACLTEFARSTWQSTEGRVRIGNVYIFKNGAYNKNISLTLLNRDGRASAHINGYGTRGMQAEHFVVFQGALERPFAIGRTITHEIGHYLLGLFDEYVEAGRNPPSPGSPGQNDNAKPSMMNSHEQFLKFSTPGDYSNEAERNTAHFRVYRESHWETLVRNPASDSELARSESNSLPRQWVQSFRGLAVPANQGALNASEAGFDSQFRSVFMAEGFQKSAFVLDRTLPADEFTSLKQAAAQAVRKQPVGALITVFAFAAEPDTPVVDARAIQSDADKDVIVTAINALQPDTSGATANVDLAITTAITAVRRNLSVADVRNVFLMTRTSSTVADATSATAREQATAITPLAIREGQPAAGAAIAKRAGAKSVPAAGRTSLADLANNTGGVFVASKKGAELEAKASTAAFEGQGGDEQAVAVAETRVLAAGQFDEVNAITNNQIDKSITFQVSESERDAGKLSYTLISPAGSTITSANPPNGITYEYDREAGVAVFKITTSAAEYNGAWKVRATANSALVEPAFVETFAESELNMTVSVTGDKASDRRPLTLVAKVRGPQAVVGATVTASLYDADGALLKSGIVLRDNGVGADTFPDDGLYSAALPVGVIGEYFVEVVAQAGANTARLSTVGSLRKGANAPDIPLPAFMRTAEVGFVADSLSADDIDRDGIPDFVEALEARDPYLRDNDVFESNRLYAMQNFRDFLAREGDVSGLSFWTNRLDGGDSKAGLSEAFLNSPEFAGSMAPVARLYQAFFQRSPDYAGLNFWASRVRSGSSLATVAESFAQSSEFISTYGSLTDAAFLDMVYRNVLGRTADTAGRNFWLGELAARRVSRGAMMGQFAQSAEFVAASGSRTLVTLIYVGMLRRSPDAGGLAFWSGQFDRGVALRVLIENFLGAAEYRARFLNL